MRRLAFLIMLFLPPACSSMTVQPNVLSKKPYNQVRYLARPHPKLTKVDTVMVVQKGERAAILYTIPALYERAIELKGRAPASAVNSGNGIYISNIKVSSYTKPEQVQVAYQDCKTEYYSEMGPEQECRTEYRSEQVSHYQCSYNGGRNDCNTVYSTESRPHYECQTVQKMQNKNRQKCETKFRTETHHVLYQQASADVYR